MKPRADGGRGSAGGATGDNPAGVTMPFWFYAACAASLIAAAALTWVFWRHDGGED